MKAIILGTSPSAGEDFHKAYKDCKKNCMVFAVNWAAKTFPADFVVTLHPNVLTYYRDGGYDCKTISYQDADINIPLHGLWSDMTSGIYAIRVAQMMGYRDITLCGLELSDPTYDKEFLRSKLSDLKDYFATVEMPEEYWWKVLVHGSVASNEDSSESK